MMIILIIRLSPKQNKKRNKNQYAAYRPTGSGNWVFFFLDKRLSDLSLSPSLPRKRGADVESRNGYTVNGASVIFFYQRRIPSSLANKVWIIIIIFNIHQICPYADKCRFHLFFIFFLYLFNTEIHAFTIKSNAMGSVPLIKELRAAGPGTEIPTYTKTGLTPFRKRINKTTQCCS